jgi:hypothetical protein
MHGRRQHPSAERRRFVQYRQAARRLRPRVRCQAVELEPSVDLAREWSVCALVLLRPHVRTRA